MREAAELIFVENGCLAQSARFNLLIVTRVRVRLVSLCSLSDGGSQLLPLTLAPKLPLQLKGCQQGGNYIGRDLDAMGDGGRHGGLSVGWGLKGVKRGEVAQKSLSPSQREGESLFSPTLAHPQSSLPTHASMYGLGST